MKIGARRLILFVLTCLYLELLLTSCADTKKVIYFNMPADTTLTYVTKSFEPTIQPNDILNISITSVNPDAATIFNTAGTSGYLVGPEGYIEFPVLGKVKAVGITKAQLKDNITNTLLQKKLLVDPVVNIRFANARIIVIGEAGHSGIVPFVNEKLSIIEAIGLAGDLPYTAKKDNVLLIREENGNKIFRHLDLTSKDIFYSPYFYLKSNDVLYIEPNKFKVKASASGGTPSWLPFAMSTLGFFLGIYSALFK